MMERGKKRFFLGLTCTLSAARCLAARGVSEEQYSRSIVTVAGRLCACAGVCQTSSNLTLALQRQNLSAVHWGGKPDKGSWRKHSEYYVFCVSIYGDGQQRGAGSHDPVDEREASKVARRNSVGERLLLRTQPLFLVYFREFDLKVVLVCPRVHLALVSFGSLPVHMPWKCSTIQIKALPREWAGSLLPKYAPDSHQSTSGTCLGAFQHQIHWIEPNSRTVWQMNEGIQGLLVMTLRNPSSTSVPIALEKKEGIFSFSSAFLLHLHVSR